MCHCVKFNVVVLDALYLSYNNGLSLNYCLRKMFVTLEDHSFRVANGKLWSDLPSTIRNISLQSFKKAIKLFKLILCLHIYS